MHRRQFIAAAVLAALTGPLAGCSGGGDTSEDRGQQATPEPTPEPTPTPTDEELALRAAAEGARGQFTEGIRSVEATSDFQGRDGYTAEVRTDLNPEVITGADRAEHMGGTVARRTIESVETSDAENVTAVAVYAYVPTTDGDDTVSTKVVVDLKMFEGVDWSAYPWQRIRDEADQYRFNSHLYG